MPTIDIEQRLFNRQLVSDTLWVIKQINSCVEFQQLITCSNLMNTHIAQRYCKDATLNKYYSKMLLFYRRRMIFIQDVNDSQITTY